MQGDVDPRPGRCCVVGMEIQEWIKRRSWIRIQECCAQSGLADFADGQILPFVSRITKTRFPVPILEIIGKSAHLATQPHVEKGIPVGEPFLSGTGIVNTAEPNYGSHGQTASIRKEIWNSRIRRGERIKRILDWHTDNEATEAYVSA